MKKSLVFVLVLLVVLILAACGGSAEPDTPDDYDYWHGVYWDSDQNNEEESQELLFENVVISQAPNAIAAGANNSFALTEDGNLWGWGFHGYFSSRDSWSDIPVHLMDNIASISIGFTHNLVVDNNGVLLGWGDNFHSQLADAAPTGNIFMPVRLMEDVIAAAAGHRHTLALTSAGVLWGWGDNSNNAINLDGTAIIETPIQIMNGVVAIAAERETSMAITADGALWRWGTGPGLDRGITHIMDDVIYIYTRSVGAPSYIVMSDVIASYAITSDGNLYGWGAYNNYDAPRQDIPIRLMTDVIAVSGTGPNTMAITSDGTLWGWGTNINGQLGNGTTTQRLDPQRIMNDVISISVGAHNTMALTADGGLWIWGSHNVDVRGDGIKRGLYPVRIN